MIFGKDVMEAQSGRLSCLLSSPSDFPSRGTKIASEPNLMRLAYYFTALNPWESYVTEFSSKRSEPTAHASRS